jgi:elongator complex protein 3
MVSSDQAEIYLLSCTSIVRDLIAGFQAGKEVSLNELRNKYAKKYKLRGVPRLVDILSAVPVEWQDRLRGALRAKPVRTASGVSMISRNCCSSPGWLNPSDNADCRCRGNVQAASMSPCSDDRKHLRVSCSCASDIGYRC